MHDGTETIHQPRPGIEPLPTARLTGDATAQDLESIRKRTSVYVYEAPVRLWHWINAACIFVLVFTGWFIGNPFPSMQIGEATHQFIFGYTRFAHSGLAFDARSLTARFNVANTGARAGTDTPQLYLTPPGGQPRLAGWARAELAPGENGTYTVTLDPRFAARFDVAANEWVLSGGTYTLRLATSATDPGMTRQVRLPEQRFAVDWRPADPLAPFSAGD